MATKLDPYIPYDISQLWARQNPDEPNPAGVNPGAMLAGVQDPSFANVDATGINPGAFVTGTEGSPPNFGSTADRVPSPTPPDFRNAQGGVVATPARDYHSPLPPAKDNMDPATMPLPTGVTRQGDYSLHGMPGMPGGPTRRSMVFTGIGPGGVPAYTNNPNDPLLRGIGGTGVGDDSIASRVARASAANNDPYKAEGAQYKNLGDQSLATENRNAMLRSIMFGTTPKTPGELATLTTAQAGAAKTKADIASTQAATAATLQGTQVAKAKALEEIAAKDRLTQIGATADTAVPGSGPRAAALAHVASGGDANDPNALQIVRQGDTGLKTEIANYINNGTRPLGTNGAFNPFNHEGNIVNPAAMNLSDIKMGRSFGKRTMTVTDSAGKEKTVFLDYGDNSLSPQLQSYLLSQQTNAAARTAATPRKSP